MSSYKEIETAAAICRNAQIVIEECLRVLKEQERLPEIRLKSYGMIGAAIDSVILARSNLKLCADLLYKALEEALDTHEET